MKKLMIILTLLALAGCNMPEWKIDQELRREIFKECMELLPEGPDQTQYNDWAEVVSECRQASRFMAQKCIRNCERGYW